MSSPLTWKLTGDIGEYVVELCQNSRYDDLRNLSKMFPKFLAFIIKSKCMYYVDYWRWYDLANVSGNTPWTTI